jgi:hypothetical protein
MSDEIEKGTPPSVPAVKAGSKKPGPGRPPKAKAPVKPAEPPAPNDEDDDDDDAQDGSFVEKATQALDNLLGL